MLCTNMITSPPFPPQTCSFGVSAMKLLALTLALALCAPCAALTVGTLARPRAFPRRCSAPQANVFDATNAAPVLIDFTNTAPVLTLLAKSDLDKAVDDLLRIFPLIFLVHRSRTASALRELL